jgi:L-alanine-DL-glutamate epimerase-like enolase superfamily enzyme
LRRRPRYSRRWRISIDDAPPLIAALETATVTARAKPALRVRGQRVTHDSSTFVIVRVVTDVGVEGYGEITATPAWSGEDEVTATHFVRDVIAPLIRGRPLAPIDSLMRELDRVVRGNPFTKAGVNTALWDALGRTRGRSVCELLGGPFRDQVPVKISLSGDDTELDEGFALARDLGFRAFKVKVGKSPAADLARVERARELAGSDAFIGVDANGGWTREDALAVVPQLARAGIAFVEQPVDAPDLDAMREVRSLGIPVVADEAVYTTQDIVNIARRRAADVVSLYVGKSAGLDRAVASAQLASSLGIGVVIGANGEMGLGAAAQLHLACACEHLAPIPCGITGHHFYEEEPTLADELDIDGLRAVLPAGPGLGVELNDDLRQTFA